MKEWYNKKEMDKENVVDTLEIARQKYPGAQNSLDALCKRFNIDNTKRKKHTALIDCELLKEVYINLVDQKEPKLDLSSNEFLEEKIFVDKSIIKKNLRKIIKPNNKEIDEHRKYLKNSLQKNFFN